MLWFDVTKSASQTHRSGLMRVSERLRAELAAQKRVPWAPVCWSERRRSWVHAGGREPVPWSSEDWLLTPELFSEAERPGMETWLRGQGGRAAAIFHDAIPLRLPDISWPRSVARHPDYLRLLAHFGHVFAVSEASAAELREWWGRLGVPARIPVQPIALGADGHGAPRVCATQARGESDLIVMVGIIEPRKNQDAVLDCLEVLRGEGVAPEVVFVGRVNPHFGRPIAKRIRRMAKAGFKVSHLESPGDDRVAALMQRARFSVLPSRAEGCGLPVLESLWAGLPVLATALPSIVESARGGGCLLVDSGDRDALADGMRRLLCDGSVVARLQSEACSRELPRWSQTVADILAGLHGT